jgi:hypothetical protein
MMIGVDGVVDRKREVEGRTGANDPDVSNCRRRHYLTSASRLRNYVLMQNPVLAHLSGRKC